MSQKMRGVRRSLHNRGSRSRSPGLKARFECLEPRSLLAASPLVPTSSAPAVDAGQSAAASKSVFFLHQSVGEGIMANHNGHRGLAAQIRAAGHTFRDYDLWSSPPGGSIPTQIASLFADQNRDGRYGDLLAQIPGARQANVLMFKSCFYTLSELGDPANLTKWKQAFIHSVAPYANQHPEQKLLAMPAVPERKSSGLPKAAAARARSWSNWLAGDFIRRYTKKHNVYSYNLFNLLADPASNRANGNYQRKTYLNGDQGDSHPNNRAYTAAANAISKYVLTTVIRRRAAPPAGAAMQGGAGDETRVVGATSHDARAAALAAVTNQGTSAGSYDDRCADVDSGALDSTGGLMQLKRKISTYPEGTVVDDRVRDTVFGTAADDRSFQFPRDFAERI